MMLFFFCSTNTVWCVVVLCTTQYNVDKSRFYMYRRSSQITSLPLLCAQARNLTSCWYCTICVSVSLSKHKPVCVEARWFGETLTCHTLAKKSRKYFCRRRLWTRLKSSGLECFGGDVCCFLKVAHLTFLPFLWFLSVRFLNDGFTRRVASQSRLPTNKHNFRTFRVSEKRSFTKFS